MKTIVLLGVVLFTPIAVPAQSNDMRFYYPDGKPYKRECSSIADINTDFDKDGRIKTFSPLCWDSAKHDCFIVIGYKLFTDQPLWVFTNSDKHITQLVKAFNYREYLDSQDFYHDLLDHISKGTLTSAFILETLGAPDMTENDGGDNRERETWTYAERGVILIIDGGLVASCQRL